VEQEASAAGQKYIPPHQRALMAASAGSSEKQAEILARLLKEFKMKKRKHKECLFTRVVDKSG